MNILEDCIAKKQAYDIVADKIKARIESFGFLSIEQLLIFKAICENTEHGISAPQIAYDYKLSINTVSTVTIRLEKEGLTRSEIDPTDISKRQLKRKIHFPTDKGKEIYTQLMQQFETE